MKGQYIALESVLALAIGLMVAIGLITAFSAYKDGILRGVEENQVDMVQSKVGQAVGSLGSMDEGQGSVDVELPERISDRPYQIELQNGQLAVFVANEDYKRDFEYINQSYTFRGSVDGGPVRVLKEENEIMVRDN